MDTIVSIVKERVKEHPDRPILRYKEDAIYKDITWGQLGRKVRLLGSFLLDIGIKINDRVAIFSENRPEWVYADLAILSTGGITVPIYATESAKNIEYLLNDSEAEVIFVSGTDRYQRVLSIARNTKIKKIILFKGIESIDPIATEFEEALERGEEKLDLYSKVLDERAKAIDGESLVTIIYTSGSTGMPKGVCLTNRNFITNCRTAVDLINITEKDRYLSFLPLSHVFERMAGYYAHLIQGSQIAYAGSRDTILQDAKSISPTLMYGVPRFFEKIYSTILNNAVKSSPLKKNLFFWAYRVGRACMYRRLKKKDIPLYLRLSKRFVTDPIAKKLKKMFGKSLRFFVSGGAPLSKEVAYFFLSFDILILEGYGLTETSPVIAVNTTSNYRAALYPELKSGYPTTERSWSRAIML